MSIDCSFANPPEVMDTITMVPDIQLYETGLTMVHFSTGMEAGQELKFPHKPYGDTEKPTNAENSAADPVEHTKLSILLLLYIMYKKHYIVLM